MADRPSVTGAGWVLSSGIGEGRSFTLKSISASDEEVQSSFLFHQRRTKS